MWFRIVIALLIAESMALSWQAVLFRPIDLGTDPSAYAAAGQRIVDGHPLYKISPGDRPVALDNPPFWTAPILSPPGAAVIWAVPVALGMTAFTIALWWLAGAVLTFGWSLIAALRGSMGAVLLAGVLAPMTAITGISGNLNALLMPIMVAAWYFTRSGTTRRQNVAAGLLIAFGAWTKLTPILVLPWFVATRRWRAAAATVVGLAVLGFLGVLVAGWDAHVAYLSIGTQTAIAGSTGVGPETLLLRLGLAPSIARFVPIAAVIGTAGLIGLLRNRPAWAFVAAVVGVVISSPIVRLESFSMLLAAAAPWIGPIVGNQVSATRIRVAGGAVIAALLVGGLIAVTLMAGSSDVAIENASSEPIIVRFVAPSLSASFGFNVPGKSSGWAWKDQPGEFQGDVVVFDETCRELFVQSIQAGTIVVSSDSAGVLSVAGAEPPSGSAALVFTSRCEEQLGPPRP